MPRTHEGATSKTVLRCAPGSHPWPDPAVPYLLFQCIHSLLSSLSPILLFSEVILILCMSPLCQLCHSIYFPHLSSQIVTKVLPVSPVSKAPHPSTCHFLYRRPFTWASFHANLTCSIFTWFPCFCYNLWKGSCNLILFINSTTWRYLDSISRYLKSISFLYFVIWCSPVHLFLFFLFAPSSQGHSVHQRVQLSFSIAIYTC